MKKGSFIKFFYIKKLSSIWIICHKTITKTKKQQQQQQFLIIKLKEKKEQNYLHISYFSDCLEWQKKLVLSYKMISLS